MAHHITPETDPKELQKAHEMWISFVKGGKYALIATCLVLIGLALAFVKFT